MDDRGMKNQDPFTQINQAQTLKHASRSGGECMSRPTTQGSVRRELCGGDHVETVASAMTPSLLNDS